MWEKFGSKRNWSWHGWCIAKFGDFGVLVLFCDLVLCGVKNENHVFGKVVGLKPHKCLQSDVGKVWEQKVLMLVWLVYSQVWWFLCFGLILWLGGVWGEKRKSWFLKSGCNQTLQMPPRWCGKRLGAKRIDLGMVGAKPCFVILVFWLDFVICWCVGRKTKNHAFWKLDGLNPFKYLQSDMGKVWEQQEFILMWVVLTKFGDVVLAWFCDLVVGGVKNEKSWFWKSCRTQTSQMPPKWCAISLGAKGIDLGMVGE